MYSALVIINFFIKILFFSYVLVFENILLETMKILFILNKMVISALVPENFK